jgi:hypothetical protein
MAPDSSLLPLFEQFEEWLKNTIPGVIFLGALGSLLAIGILKIATMTATRIVPLPIGLHKERRLRQAYLLGYIHRLIHDEESPKPLIAFLVFRLSCLGVWLATSMLSILLFALVVSSGSAALTAVSFISVVIAFTAMYLAYFEFEYLYRTYLFYWKSALRDASESYREQYGQEARGESEPKGGDPDRNKPEEKRSVVSS